MLVGPMVHELGGEEKKKKRANNAPLPEQAWGVPNDNPY